jgi:hypothetical protein
MLLGRSLPAARPQMCSFEHTLCAIQAGQPDGIRSRGLLFLGDKCLRIEPPGGGIFSYLSSVKELYRILEGFSHNFQNDIFMISLAPIPAARTPPVMATVFRKSRRFSFRGFIFYLDFYISFVLVILFAPV